MDKIELRPVISFILARIFILFATYDPFTSDFCSRWKTILHHHRVTIKSYTFQWHTKPCVVYARISLLHPLFYIGSSRHNVLSREDTRKRKFFQLTSMKLVHAEPALKYWQSKKNFFRYHPIALSHPTPSNLDAEENTEIQQLQPGLNTPWVYSRLKNRPSPAPTTANFASCKLWKRLRRKLKKCSTYGMHITGVYRRKQAWRTLFDLCSTTKRSYSTQRYLRSARVNTLQLYALYRLSNHLQEPRKSLCRSQLKRILRFRKCIVPTSIPPLTIPWLICSQFQSVTKHWLQRLIRTHSMQFPPFHHPKSTILQGKTISVGMLLHNWKHWAQTYIHARPQCPCHAMKLKIPWLPTTGNHIAGSFAEVTLPLDFRVLSESAKNLVHLSKQFYTEFTWNKICRWLQRQRITADESLKRTWEQHVHYLWPEHLQQIAESPFTFDKIAKCKQLVADLVCHCEDHAPDSLCIYCPQLYYDTAMSLFGDPEVFQSLETSPTCFQQHYSDYLPSVVTKYYKWGLDKHKGLPKAYLFLKRKKLWKKARPIIAYNDTILGNLLSPLGVLIQQLIDSNYPSSFSHLNPKDILAKLHQFMRYHSSIASCTNDDLVGFFTSVPHDRILNAAKHMLARHLATNNLNAEEATFTVQMQEQQKTLRVFNGKYRTPSNKRYTFQAAHFVELCQTALQCSHFVYAGKLFKQTRGTPIGGPASPALAQLTVCFEEQIWSECFETTRRNLSMLSQALCIRYVDNRMIILSKQLAEDPAMQLLLSQNFYREPIQLELVDDMHFVGYNLDLTNRAVEYIMPLQQWQIRHPASAGSTSLKLSSLSSRLYLIKRGVYPHQTAWPTARSLANLYITKGFHPQDVNNILNRVIGPKAKNKNESSLSLIYFIYQVALPLFSAPRITYIHSLVKLRNKSVTIIHAVCFLLKIDVCLYVPSSLTDCFSHASVHRMQRDHPGSHDASHRNQMLHAQCSSNQAHQALP